MSSNSVCNHSHDEQIGLPLRNVRFGHHSFDYKSNWTPLLLSPFIKSRFFTHNSISRLNFIPPSYLQKRPLHIGTKTFFMCAHTSRYFYAKRRFGFRYQWSRNTTCKRQAPRNNCKFFWTLNI